jgi:hypothetical protein
VLTEENLDRIEARLEHKPQKSMRCFVQEIDMTVSSAAIAMKLFKLRPYKATVIHALQPHDPANRIDKNSTEEPRCQRRLNKKI